MHCRLVVCHRCRWACMRVYLQVLLLSTICLLSSKTIVLDKVKSRKCLLKCGYCWNVIRKAAQEMPGRCWQGKQFYKQYHSRHVRPHQISSHPGEQGARSVCSLFTELAALTILSPNWFYQGHSNGSNNRQKSHCYSHVNENGELFEVLNWAMLFSCW